MTLSYQTVVGAIDGCGLVARGGFHCLDTDGVPPPPGARAAGSLVLVGTAGARGWRAFRHSPEWGSDPDPLDRFSERVVRGVARRFGAGALFPFGGPPWLPFQRWARRSEPLWPSPLGHLIHPRYGLWHAYRGALVFSEPLASLPEPSPEPHPCESCLDKPCLQACPVGAFSADRYDVPACAAHLERHPGGACFTQGCLARAACPIGADRRYERDQRTFHMQAFYRSHAPPG